MERRPRTVRIAVALDCEAAARKRHRLVRLAPWLLGATVAGCCLAVVTVIVWWWPIPFILAVYFAYVGAELARVDGIPPLAVAGLLLAVELAATYAGLYAVAAIY